MPFLSYVTEFFNKYFFAPAVPALMLFAGVFLFFKLRFWRILNPVKIAKTLFRKKSGYGVSPFRALTVALAGTLGVGNISGVALALVAGGAGAVFWMWVSALLAMVLKYSETVLALYHRRRNGKEYYGGAMYYIERGMRASDSIKGGAAKTAACVFAAVCLFASLTTGGVIQSSAVAEAFCGKLGISPLVSGLILAALTALVVFGGAAKVSSMTVRLVPFMSLLYIALSVVIIAANAERIPWALSLIFEDAFTPDAAAGGVLGFLMSRSMRYGVTRGLFSNEAGCGTATIAHASSNAENPCEQGVFGIVEVFVDTVVLCTLTALVLIFASDGVPSDDGGGGVMLTLRAFESVFGSVAGYVLTASVFLFAYATIICWAYYGAECLRYFSSNKGLKNIFLVLYCASVVYGATAATDFIWSLADFSISALLILNTVCVTVMSDTIYSCEKNISPSVGIRRQLPRQREPRS